MFEKNIWAQAERSHASSLNNLLGYEKVMDHLEIWPTYSHSNKKLFEGILILCIWSPASDVKLSSEIMISKLDRESAKQPIGISRNHHTILKIISLWLKVYHSFISAVRFGTWLIHS